MAYYWALVKTEGLIMGQLTMQPELLHKNWVLSEPLSHQAARAQQHSISRGKWDIGDRVQAGPEGTSKLHDMTQISMVPTPTTQPFLSLGLLLRPPGMLPMISRRGDVGLLCRWFCMICRYHPKVNRCGPTAPSWDIPAAQG